MNDNQEQDIPNLNEDSKQISKKKSFCDKFSIISIIGGVLGILGGYLYYSKIGCSSGTCAITANPWMSMIWGGLMGYLLVNIFTGKGCATGK